MNGMTNTGAMSRSGDLYRNINSIESKCAELISQIDDHLYVSDNRSLITRNVRFNLRIWVFGSYIFYSFG